MGPEHTRHRWGGQKDALAGDQDRKKGLRTANTDGGGQKHTPTRDEETKGGLSTANTDGGGQKHRLARGQRRV